MGPVHLAFMSELIGLSSRAAVQDYNMQTYIHGSLTSNPGITNNNYVQSRNLPGIFRVNGFIPVSIIWSGQGSVALTAESALLDAEMFGLVNESFFEKVPRLLISAERYSLVTEVLANLDRYFT